MATASAAENGEPTPPAATGSTAAVVVVGDEVLKGYTRDTNSHFLARRLFAAGVRLQSICVIPDDVDVIAAAVRRAAGRHDHVFTSGGVGPTHDDLTMQGVALALDDTLALSDELASLVQKYFGARAGGRVPRDSPYMKLAKIPTRSRLLWGEHRSGERSLYPVVQCGNVVVLPGIPSLFEKAFDGVQQLVLGERRGGAFVARRLYLASDEFAVADALTAAARLFRGRRVNIGSYPDFANSYYRVKVTVDGGDGESVDAAHEHLRRALRDHVAAGYDPEPEADSVAKFDRFLAAAQQSDAAFADKVRRADDIVARAFGEYGAARLAVSFNGGKDCTALLHLAHVSAMRLRAAAGDSACGALASFYVRPPKSFPQVERFVAGALGRYALSPHTYEGRIRPAVHQLCADNTDMKAVLMGGRKSDPGHENLAPFQMCDAGWPDLMRVHPMLDWEYADVWKFLRGLSLKYCTLYDRGYTSVGCADTTAPNEALAYVEPATGLRRYRPAHTLQDGSLERANRIGASSGEVDKSKV